MMPIVPYRLLASDSGGGALGADFAYDPADGGTAFRRGSVGSDGELAVPHLHHAARVGSVFGFLNFRRTARGVRVGETGSDQDETEESD